MQITASRDTAMMCFGRSPTRSDEKHTPMISTTATKSGEGSQLAGSEVGLTNWDCHLQTLVRTALYLHRVIKRRSSLTYCAILPV